MISLKSVHSGIGQPFLALVCPQWDWQLFSFVKWPQWDAQPQKCAQWDRQGRGRADLSHCAHFWGWSSHCGHFTNEKSCLSHCAHTRARKGWPIPLCTLLRLSIPLWPFYKWEELPIPLWTHKGEEGLTYHTVHTFEAEHTTVAIVQMRRAAYPTVHTQGRGRADLSHCAHFWGWASHCGHFTNEKSCLSHCAHTRARKGWPIPLCTLLRLSIPLWPLYKWEEMPIPLYTHKGEEGLTYPTVHTSEAEHPTVAILQMRRAAYPTVHTQGRGRADLSHCAHFWGWASHCGHCTNEKRCLSHCGHTRARKGWPITLCTLLRLPQWYAQPQKCAQCDRQGRGRADLSHCAHFWGWASHCGHFTNEKSCQSHCGHTRARKGWPITLCTLLRLSIPLWPLYKWEELPIPLCTHKGEEGLTYPTVHTFEAEHPTVAILQMRRAAYPTVHTQGRGRADLSHCAHFWGWASHSGHCTNEKRCLSHCTHTRARKGWPIPLCTLLRLSIPLWPFYKWEELPIPLCTHKGEEGLTYPTVHTFEAEHPTVAIVQMRRDAYPTVDTQGRGRADLSHCAHFWGWAYHCGHCTNEKSCLSHCAHISPSSPLCVHSGISSSSHL